ncbi:MAG: ABC transporter permease [Patescibacteria group bacterium]
MIERFRSLPMARSAVLAGRIISDTLRNLFVVLLMTLVGLLLGFDVKTSFGGYLGAMAITLLLGFSFSWISALIGVSVKNVETAQTAGFIWVFPLVFASSIFVPIATMPDWLQTIAKHSPITATVDTVRALILGGGFQSQLGNALWWALAIVAVFMPWAVHRYRTSAV